MEIYENIIYENIDKVFELPTDGWIDECLDQFEISEIVHANIVLKEEEQPQVFYVLSGSEGNFKLEEELIIESEHNVIIPTSQSHHTDQIYNTANSSFDELMENYIEDEINLLDPNEKMLLDLISEDPLKIACEICHRSFAKKCYLTQHMNYKHTDKPFKCIKCNKKFAHLEALENHISKHLNVNKSFLCPIEGCRKAYAYKADLKIHYKNNHKEDMKSHVCECGKRFARKDHLTKHKRSHVRKVLKISLEN